MTPEAFRAKVAHTRLDFMQQGPHLTGVLTVSLPNGKQYTARKTIDLEALFALAMRKIHATEVGGMVEIGGELIEVGGLDVAGFLKWVGRLRREVDAAAFKRNGWAMVHDARGELVRVTAAGAKAWLAEQRHHFVHAGFLSKLWRGVKKAGRAIVSSGVFKAAAGVLTKLGGALPPPIGPAALAVGSTMTAARALLAAKKHAAAGNLGAAEQLVRHARESIPASLRPVAEAQAANLARHLPASASHARRAIASARAHARRGNLPAARRLLAVARAVMPVGPVTPAQAFALMMQG